MKLAVVGSREWKNREVLEDLLDGYRITFPDLTIVSGGAKGADTMGEEWARLWKIPTQIFLADWNTHGKSAGFIRNYDIVRVSDMILAFVVPAPCDGFCNGKGRYATFGGETSTCNKCRGRGWLPTKGTFHTVQTAVNVGKHPLIITPDGVSHQWSVR